MKVLSPAGSLETFYSALFNGADEIYMGINAFNARAKANNISDEDIAKAITDAHILGVQVFCTLNTLIFEDELADVAKTIVRAMNLGFDAYIVQDLAVVRLIKEINPQAVIHLSTQLGLHNSFGALQAKKLGAKRIVLSREACLEDIIAIKKAVPEMEIEYFVQGALCVAFSGNCYLSNRLLNKSGNRGECAQLCRLPYCARIADTKKGDGYYLSPADLNLYTHLQELEDAGVTSLKIEGRLKRPSYVGQTARFYRKAVDALKNTNIKITDNDIENLKITFNRGNYLKDAYLYKGAFDNIIYSKTQNHIGIRIGKVISCERFKDIYKIGLKVDKFITQNDGLKIFRNGKEVASLGVGNVEIFGNNTYIFSKQKLMQNDDVHLIHSEKLEKDILNAVKICEIDFDCEFKVGERAKIVAKLKNHNLVFDVIGDEILASANKCPLTSNDVEISMSKLNANIFKVGKINITLENVFMAKSSLNKLRRDIINKVIDYFKPKQIECDIDAVLSKVHNSINPINQNEQLVLRLSRELNIKLSNIAYFPRDYLSKKTFDDINNYLKYNDKVYLFLPPFLTDCDIKKIYEVFKEYKQNIVILANNIGQMCFAKEYETIACDYCNITNSISLNEYRNLGAKKIALGFEFKDRNNKSIKYDTCLNGNNIVCFLSHCPYKVVNGNNCNNCSFTNNLSYQSDGGTTYYVGRFKVQRCYFYLTTNKENV